MSGKLNGMNENETSLGAAGSGGPRTADHTTLTQPVTPAAPDAGSPASAWSRPSPYPPAAQAPTGPTPTAPAPTPGQPAIGPALPGYEGYQGYPTGPATQAYPTYPTDPPGPPPRTATGGGWRRGVVATVAAAAIALTAGGIGGFVGYGLHDEADGPLQTTPASSGDVKVVDRSSLGDIAAKVQPTVVDIKTDSGEGSGVVISADGYVVTNNHVVATARGDTVTVTFNSGRKLTGRIVGADAKTDIAVVKVDAAGLTFAAWADSDQVRVGDTVLAIGSPLGLEGSVTAGIVSALHRTISVGDESSPFGGSGGAQTTIGDAIQTDAAINQGNSGGALVNLDGQIIGINSAIATSGSSGNIGVGFAISSNRAKAVADQLIKGQKVSHPYLGVSVGDADGGAQIQTVSPGSPADRAGLEVGDVVTKIGDRAIANSEDLVGAIQSSQVGAQLNLTVKRGGSEQTVSVTVGEAP